MNTLKTIETRLENKSKGLTADKNKVGNLKHQIAQYTTSVNTIEAGLPQKEEEVQKLTAYFDEARSLSERSDELGAQMIKIREHFDQFEWSVDMPYEHKLESSTEYARMLQERQVAEARLVELEKLANKVYYRR